MFICCTGIGLLVQEQKVAELVLADLIIPEIHFSVTAAVHSWGFNIYLPICRSLHLLGPLFQRYWARQHLTHSFSESNQKNNPNACKFPANARTYPTRDFIASCDTACKSHLMCASSDGKSSKHAKNEFQQKTYIFAVNAKVKVQLTTSKLSWTQKFPQPEMFSQEIKNKQTELNCECVNFSTVYLYIVLFCAKWHWFGHIVAT